MDPRRKSGRQRHRDIQGEAPATLPDSFVTDDEPGPDAIPSGAHSEEDDGNPYQNSDEVLPDDGDEAVIARNRSGKGGRFDDI